uniref:Uncharacterized protein n=1 Tax=Setaria viridis TaxID=4556 RepID=A0A4U6T6I2_SETVI|nr:hypothetical protein SEVIR_9G451950v2 [Setaria viridis]
MEVEVTVDPWALRRGAREEARPPVVEEVDEDAAHGVREKVRALQPKGVDGGAPRRADATGLREAAPRQPAEDGLEHVVR